MRNSILKSAVSALSIIFGITTMTAKTSYIFLAPGVEEVEATATVDALRRASIDVVTVAVGDNLQVKGATGQILVADSLISDVDTEDADWLIIPGGDPGAQNLASDSSLRDKIVDHVRKNGRIASICAGPAVVLAPLGVLKGKKATCYPGLGDAINANGGQYVEQTVVVDPGLISSEGPGTTLPFAIEIIRATKGDKAAEAVASGMLVSKN